MWSQIYYPKSNTVEEYDLGKERAMIDQFLLLGFGSSSGIYKTRTRSGWAATKR